ncbi:hypothetical protein FA09DRAFT_297103, partial [Tilletiopsis washingtonensis]
QNGNPGHCSHYNSDSTPLVALPSAIYANGAHCGKKVIIHRGSKSVEAVVADSCPTCVSSHSLDLSVAAFKALGTEQEGMFDITWSWA